MHRFLIIPILCLAFCHGVVLADYVHTWSTQDAKNGCMEHKTIQKDGLGCMNYSRPCGQAYWTNDGCGWDEFCNGIVIPSNATSDPFVVAPDYGIIVSVIAGTGGYFTSVGPPATCGGGNPIYTTWEFHPDGGSSVIMPPAMTQLH